MHRYDTPTLQRGFTLIELVTTLTVLMIAASLLAPGFTYLIQQIRLFSVTTELYNAINLTRSEAIKRNDIVDLIAVNKDWKNGWVVNGTDDQQIIAHEPLPKEFEVSAKFTDGLQHIAYSGSGRSCSCTKTTGPQSGHIQLSLQAHTRIIVINFLGRPRICNPSSDQSCAPD